MKTSGFMIIKNGVIQGYPFIEAVLSALPICDEFLISEGYSSDETWKLLCKLQDKYPDKIKLFRDNWRGKVWKGEIIASMSNVLKRRCKGEYCLYVQANEIIHESTTKEIRNLLKFYPNVEIFLLPFFNIVGDKFLFDIQFRKRLVKNLDYIIVKGDGYQLGYDVKKLILIRPRKFLNYLLHRVGERTFYLSKPIYRYRALFPKNYIKKLETRFELYHNDTDIIAFNEEYKIAKNILSNIDVSKSSSNLFWENIASFFEDSYWKFSSYGVSRGIIGIIHDHPRIMRHLLGKWKYEFEDVAKYLSKNRNDIQL